MRGLVQPTPRPCHFYPGPYIFNYPSSCFWLLKLLLALSRALTGSHADPPHGVVKRSWGTVRHLRNLIYSWVQKGLVQGRVAHAEALSQKLRWGAGFQIVPNLGQRLFSIPRDKRVTRNLVLLALQTFKFLGLPQWGKKPLCVWLPSCHTYGILMTY